MKTLCAAIVLLALAMPASAEEFMWQGIGVAACATITAYYHLARSAEEIVRWDLMVGSWTSGYMSAINTARMLQGNDTQNLATVDTTAQVIAIRRYCKHNPNKKMIDAVMSLYGDLSSNVDGGESAGGVR